MPIFDPSTLANVKNPNGVLVGIAQIRIATQTSIRSALTASMGTVIPVGQSTVFTDATDGTTEIVRPGAVYVANSSTAMKLAGGGTGTISASGTYTGAYDGAFIIRATSATAGKVYAPDGTATPFTITTGSLSTSPAAILGLTITGTGLQTTGAPAAGDTWVIPVVAGTAQANLQTGIISPFSLFRGATNSVGGLKDASWDPKIDSIQTLESGFPATVNDQIIAKTSAGFKFNAYEYDGTIPQVLRGMVNAAVNVGDVQAVAAEVVFRYRGGNLVTYWCPSCTIANAPSINPSNDYSAINWELRVNDQTEAGATGAYAAWLRNSQLYYELGHPH